jgi:hypothetical protein
LASNKSTLAQLGHHKAQRKKVLNHAREELMKEVRKAGYNALVVGVRFLVCSFVGRVVLIVGVSVAGENSHSYVKESATALKPSTVLVLPLPCLIWWRVCWYHAAHST